MAIERLMGNPFIYLYTENLQIPILSANSWTDKLFMLMNLLMASAEYLLMILTIPYIEKKDQGVL